ncbi:hypothetical protein GGTG_09635 [Gaeumannomyces tritici R3-111a-1]|uniref:Uncharacterized protein n=1 Tax=Gaeumannomyces tritici (strain R3-111a-1) TaxID=644352 RepID=J3P7Z7_GAET3|nr:hypothetical protein GGTG_09635 [Gaeumannomyces tritici R3-111a-1]EJT72780.1 hypothetical protein GGTG_09635 [Gaeumannomyces tritici R3-111a-1]
MGSNQRVNPSNQSGVPASGDLRPTWVERAVSSLASDLQSETAAVTRRCNIKPTATHVEAEAPAAATVATATQAAYWQRNGTIQTPACPRQVGSTYRFIFGKPSARAF